MLLRTPDVEVYEKRKNAPGRGGFKYPYNFAKHPLNETYF